MLSNGALKFSRVTLGDAGTYQCLAQNEAGTAVGRTKLVLQGKYTLYLLIDLTELPGKERLDLPTTHFV